MCSRPQSARRAPASGHGALEWSRRGPYNDCGRIRFRPPEYAKWRSGLAPALDPLYHFARPTRTGTVPWTEWPEGVSIPRGPSLASLKSAASGRTVDRIQCTGQEQLVFHVHAHLTIFVTGATRRVPLGIGIPGEQTQRTSSGHFVDAGNCFYSLHTHAADGIIHIESPTRRTYTLGQFFDEWGQALGVDQVGPATGAVTAFYDGNVYQGNPRTIPLGAHTQIQLDVGPRRWPQRKIRFVPVSRTQDHQARPQPALMGLG